LFLFRHPHDYSKKRDTRAEGGVSRKKIHSNRASHLQQEPLLALKKRTVGNLPYV
jgi:hypothetical protein